MPVSLQPLFDSIFKPIRQAFRLKRRAIASAPWQTPCGSRRKELLALMTCAGAAPRDLVAQPRCRTPKCCQTKRVGPLPLVRSCPGTWFRMPAIGRRRRLLRWSLHCQKHIVAVRWFGNRHQIGIGELVGIDPCRAHRPKTGHLGLVVHRVNIERQVKLIG